jgi:hypothetical protein
MHEQLNGSPRFAFVIVAAQMQAVMRNNTACTVGQGAHCLEPLDHLRPKRLVNVSLGNGKLFAVSALLSARCVKDLKKTNICREKAEKCRRAQREQQPPNPMLHVKNHPFIIYNTHFTTNLAFFQSFLVKKQHFEKNLVGSG